jgi:hypothetical protein
MVKVLADFTANGRTMPPQRRNDRRDGKLGVAHLLDPPPFR